MAASFLEKIISKLHEEGRYPKGLFDSPLSPVCCNKQSIHILHLSIIYHHYEILLVVFLFPLRTLGLNRHRLQTILGSFHGGYLNASLGTSALKALLLHRVLLLVLSLVGGDLDVVGVRQRSLIGSPQILRD